MVDWRRLRRSSPDSVRDVGLVQQAIGAGDRFRTDDLVLGKHRIAQGRALRLITKD